MFAGLEPIVVARMKFEAFNDGFQGDTLAQNFSSCNYRWLDMQYYEWPAVRAKLYYSSADEFISNGTIFLRNSSYPLNYCTDTL